MKHSLKIAFLMSLLYLNGVAEINSTCIEKINQLNELKSQQNSALEKTAAFLFTNNLTAFQKNKDDKILEQKIRLLEIELKSCKD
ncbi:MAG: hypothetical protein Q7S59_04200 [Sulfurimonas sp.]|nr:hypothetical protein [Sulfurimonas sp.]